MLTCEERREMIEDGRSRKRGKEFARVRQAAGNNKSSTSRDEFIRFLADIQKVFCQAAISRKKTITRFNKL